MTFWILIVSQATPFNLWEKEGLVTPRTSSCTCSKILERPIRSQLFNVTIVTRTCNNHALLLNIARLYECNDRQVRTAQYKLNVTSRKTAHYCIPAAQLHVREVTRPSFSQRLKGVACETRILRVLFDRFWVEIIGSKDFCVTVSFFVFF